uniref:Uncharacterized protein n=1 Tax=Heterorhabditis bacteriophora TaxID=37862 RepID=A0A1I7X2Y3_HETBA
MEIQATTLSEPVSTGNLYSNPNLEQECEDCEDTNIPSPTVTTNDEAHSSGTTRIQRSCILYLITTLLLTALIKQTSAVIVDPNKSSLEYTTKGF